MPITSIVSDGNGTPLNSGKLIVQTLFEGLRNSLIFGSVPFSHGVWNSETLSGAATTTIATCPEGGSLIVTDVVISAKKVNSTTLLVCFDDGTNTKIFSAPDTVQQSTNFSWSPVGRVQGWRDANINAVTTGANFDGTVYIGYIIINEGQSYNQWLNRR